MRTISPLLVRIASTSVALGVMLLGPTSAALADSFVGADISTSAGGTITSSGLLTASLGFISTGAEINLNASSNFAVNIATGNSLGIVSIGNSLADVAIIDPQWSVTGAGAATFASIAGPLTGNASTATALAANAANCAAGQAPLGIDASGAVEGCTAYIVPILTDNIVDALDIQEGTNSYININTTNAAENISFGNATTNPMFTFVGTGVMTAGTVDINGGAIDGTTIGGIVAAAGTFTTVTASGAIAANGGITFDSAADLVGAHTLSGTIDAATNIITNIGNAGTDFLGTGGLTLANAFTVTTGGATIGGHITSTGPTAVNAATGTCSSVTVTGTDTRGTIVATCIIGQTVIINFGTAYAAAPICLVSAANAAAEIGSAHLASTTTNMTLTSTAAATAGNWKYHCIE